MVGRIELAASAAAGWFETLTRSDKYSAEVFRSLSVKAYIMNISGIDRKGINGNFLSPMMA